MEADGFDLSPPTDDRPFFFQAANLFSPQPAGAKTGKNEAAIGVLRTILGLLTGLTGLLLLLPLVLARKLKRERGFWGGTMYFAAIGMGFMFVEIPWIQRAILYLGHPSHATAAVLGALLFAASLGSFASARINRALVARYALLLPVAIVVANLLVGAIYGGTLGFSFSLRVAIVVVITGIPGFLMGFAFPHGMTLLGEANKAWFWSVNCAAGVLASALALAVAMAWGFLVVGMVGAFFYVVAVVSQARAMVRA